MPWSSAAKMLCEVLSPHLTAFIIDDSTGMRRKEVYEESDVYMHCHHYGVSSLSRQCEF